MRTPAQVAEVAALRASGLTHEDIAKRTGIPRRTVSRMLATQPAAELVDAGTAATMATVLRTTLDKSIATLNRLLDDPRAKVGEVAQAVRVLSEQLALLEGRATANVAVAVGPERASITGAADEYAAEHGMDAWEVRAWVAGAIDWILAIHADVGKERHDAAATAYRAVVDTGTTPRVAAVLGLLRGLTDEQSRELAVALDAPALPLPAVVPLALTNGSDPADAESEDVERWD